MAPSRPIADGQDVITFVRNRPIAVAQFDCDASYHLPAKTFRTQNLRQKTCWNRVGNHGVACRS
jgi:hypothetical protein